MLLPPVTGQNSLVPGLFVVFAQAGRLMCRPAIAGPSAIGTLGAFAAFRWLGTEGGVTSLSPGALWLLGVVVSMRFWIGLSVSKTAVELLRAGERWRPFTLVAPAVALEAACVSVVIVLPILAGAIFLIIPGVFLALRWSQVPLLIADGQARWLSALDASVDVVHGHKLDILAVWLLVGAGLALMLPVGEMLRTVGGAVGLPPSLLVAGRWLVQIPIDAFSLSLAGAIFFEVDRLSDEPIPDQKQAA